MAKTDQSRQVADLNAAPYSEDNENHVPDPTAQFGTLDTSGTAGGNHEKLEMISPIFDVAKAQDVAFAARAVDPDDEEVDESTHVVLPDAGRDAEMAREMIRKRADALTQGEGVPVQDPSLTEADKENKTKDNEDANRTAARTENQQRGTSPLG